MIKLDDAERTDPAWVNWRKECESEQATLDAAALAYDPTKPEPNPKPKVSKETYDRLKEDHYAALKAPFWGKCAYCEQLIRGTQPGDVEYFRPKGRVTDAKTTKKLRTRNGQRDHPGYYWLAYEWTNLLFACDACNRPHSRSSDGRRIGKWDHFPLDNEHQRAEKKGEEAKERPLLINPLMEDPATHLAIDSTGVLKAVNNSQRGKTVIAMLGLNERGLPDERKRAYDDARRLYRELRMAVLDDNTSKLEDLKPRLQEIVTGSRPYAMATRQAVKDEKTEIARKAALHGL